MTAIGTKATNRMRAAGLRALGSPPDFGAAPSRLCSGWPSTGAGSKPHVSKAHVSTDDCGPCHDANHIRARERRGPGAKRCALDRADRPAAARGGRAQGRAGHRRARHRSQGRHLPGHVRGGGRRQRPPADGRRAVPDRFDDQGDHLRRGHAAHRAGQIRARRSGGEVPAGAGEAAGLRTPSMPRPETISCIRHRSR